MKKNIFDRSAADGIATRLQALSSEGKAAWGTMNAAQMLRHCNDVHAAILDTTPARLKPSTLKQRIIKLLLMYVLPSLPKGIKGPARFEQEGNPASPDFEAERLRFEGLLKRYPEHAGEIILSHPKAGRLSTRQWGKFVWMHMDHHLRQFGV